MLQLPSNLPPIPGLTTPPPPVPVAVAPTLPSSPLLHKVQSPLEALNPLMDQWLVAHKHGGPTVLWAVHLLVSVVLTLALAWAVGSLCRTLGRYLAKRNHKLPATL